MRRVEVTGGEAPNFIGAWLMDNPLICDEIVAFFECNSGLQSAGSTVSGVDISQKKSIDIGIDPKDLTKPTHAPFRAYLQELHRCYLDYLLQWPFLEDTLKEVDIGPFNVQKYKVGGHYAKVHTERASAFTMHRTLAWMTYLNDVDRGGHTHFSHYGLDVKPERGKTLIWPTDWTHAHTGKLVTSGVKYIITGWMYYPVITDIAEVEFQELAAERE